MQGKQDNLAFICYGEHCSNRGIGVIVKAIEMAGIIPPP